jgi:hypothetical protein
MKSKRRPFVIITTLEQTKAVLRATPIEQRINLLTDIFLETGNEEIMRFTENYRWVLGQNDRRKAKKAFPCLPRPEEDNQLSPKEASDGMDEVKQ